MVFRQTIDVALIDTIVRIPCLACADLNPEEALRNMRTTTIKSIPHYIRVKSDLYWNVMPMCLRCHLLVRDVGIEELSLHNDTVYRWLINSGWVLSESRKRWIHK